MKAAGLEFLHLCLLQVLLWSASRGDMKPASERGLAHGQGEGVGSLNWLPRKAAPSTAVLLVGDALNRQLQLYSVERDGAMELRQSLQLDSRDGKAGLCNAIAVQPLASLVVLANMERKAVYVLHVQLSEAEGANFDYLTKYQLGWPILSMEAESGLSGGVARLFCVQTHAIQAYALQLAECLPLRDVSPAQQHPMSSLTAAPENSAGGPVMPDVMPSHALLDSEDEYGASRPASAALGSPNLDAGLPQPPPPVTTPPAAAVTQPRLLTPKQLIKLAGSRTASLSSAVSADAREAARDGQLGGSQPFGLQRAPTPPAKPPSPALSGPPAAFGDRSPMLGGTVAGDEPVASPQAPSETPSPATNGTAAAPVKILKRRKDGEASAQPDSSEVSICRHQQHATRSIDVVMACCALPSCTSVNAQWNCAAEQCR